MEINTDKLVDILSNDQPLSVVMVEEHGKEKLICLFALPELQEKINEFAKDILNRTNK